MKNAVLNFIMSVLNSYDGMVNQVLSILSFNCFSSDSAYVGGMYTLAQSVRTVVMPISLTIITIVFLIEFLKITIDMNILKYEYAMKIAFKFTIAKFAIEVVEYLFNAIYATSSDWITNIGSSSSTLGSTAGVLLKQQFDKMGTLEVLGVIISGGLMFLIIMACAIVMNVIAYARIFEIMIYISISPLPCAFVPMENSRIPVKFVASFIGVCLQGVFMAISIKMYVVLSASIIQNIVNSDGATIWTVIYNLVIGSVVCLMAVIKSGQWANKIFDAI